MKIGIAGLGYVGLSCAVLLARKHEVSAYDPDADKISLLKEGISPIDDIDIIRSIREDELSLDATSDKAAAYTGCDIVVIATPTNYDPDQNCFDTATVEEAINDVLAVNTQALIVIKSTIPVGFTEGLRQRLGIDNLVFSPEFLREGRALHDNLHPSRVIVGERSERARKFADILCDCAVKDDIPIFLTNSTEAEAIKLFSNTFLAMRVAYFNELDSYALTHDLDPRQIIDGICADPRIGGGYNNPSFGYGGYCLPKDTRQLLSGFAGVPQNLIQAIVDSNSTRISFIVDRILARKPSCVGAYRLIMKSGSDNFRDAAIIKVIRRLAEKGVAVRIYEPVIHSDDFQEFEVIRDLDQFAGQCDVIIANRIDKELRFYSNKVFTRDLFGYD